MKNIYLSILFLLASVAVQAQTLKSYICQEPSIVVDGARTVWIDNLKVKEAVGWWLTLDRGISGQIKRHVTWSTRGGNVQKLYNPWMRTDWYTLAKSKAEADILVEGTIEATRNEKKDFASKQYTAKQGIANGSLVPYTVRSYSYSREVTAKVHITIKKKDGSLLKELTFTTTKSHQPKSEGLPPKLASWGKIKLAVMNEVIKTVTRDFLPVLRERNLFVTKHKFADKALKKQFKQVNDFNGVEELKQACALFEREAETAGSAAAKNAGVLHYLLGNYKEAERYLIHGKHAKAAQLIQEMKNTTEMFERVGVKPYKQEL